ncbi:hypothetical protein BDZ88DRAFT_482777 [Geranomyces variabilis]|nr:hypothetical protein BDZ88DRAFT_482777 [Geranomyces variabilis]KAJ3138535.1 mitochondrial metallopeptidase [Geranomyces variabilis]
MSELVDHPNSGSPARAAAETGFQHDIAVYAMIKKDIASHDQNPAGKTVSLLTSHVDVAQEGISGSLGQLVQGMFGFAIGVVFSLAFAWRLALPLVAYMWVFCPGLGPRSCQGAAKGDLGIANEVFGAIRTIKVFGAEHFEIRRSAEKLASMSLA